MKFRICDRKEQIVYKRDIIWLQFHKWDDFGYQTSFNVYYYDFMGRECFWGSMKLGIKDMALGSILERLPKEFTQLPDTFFSLGQDDSYYESISKLGVLKREEILIALQDVAYNLKLFEKYHFEEVMQKSLLRNISAFSVEGQFHRMAVGGARLTNYKFSYKVPLTVDMEKPKQPHMEFEVIPESNPPTNVHVLIGRNGSGKTRLIKNMIHSIQLQDGSWELSSIPSKIGRFRQAGFANIVCIAFSPFDDFSELEIEEPLIPWAFIGLNKQEGNLLNNIGEQFFSAFSNCMMVAWKRRLWLESIEILKSDPIFADEELNLLAVDLDYMTDENSIHMKKREIMEVFSRLSSGHKVVLLIVTGCVDKIEEKSIVFMDEPENHLHPPLVSALIRAMSNLLVDRNGVAVISTHSPIVLQEVPTNCVWIVNRFGQYLNVVRPSIQTFGANIGALIRDVFGLEVSESGYHKMLSGVVKRLDKEEKLLSTDAEKLTDYDVVVEKFGDQLGDEADLLLRTLLALRRRGEL